MVDLNATQNFEYKLFRGVNKRDDENNLVYGQTPNAQNFEIVAQTGLEKREGWTEKFDELDYSYRLNNTYNYTTESGDNYYITASYPEMLLINTENGFTTTIDRTLVSDGEPFFFEVSAGQGIFLDGANAPRLITNGVVSTVSWPPTWSVQNNSLLNESNNATQSNPTTFGTDIGWPSFGAFYQNRAVLSGDPCAPYRLYFSKLFDYDEFGNNNSGTINIAFWIDVDTRSPVTAIKVVNNEYLVIYCEREIHVLTGIFPPGTTFPAPYIQLKALNREVGCPHWRLVADKGNNDHFFIANNGTVYQFLNTDNFQDVRPKGISSKIFPLIKGLSLDTLSRGKLVNHFIKGELQLWLPSENYLSTPDQRFIYDYGDSNQDEEWAIDNGFGGDFHFIDAFVDRATNNLTIVTRNKYLDGNTGVTYDGETIDTFYQLTTLDFGNSDNRKEIEKIIIYATNVNDDAADTTLTFYHMWEDNRSGTQDLVLPAVTSAIFGSATYGTSTYTSFAGSPFTKIEFSPANPSGKILKCRIRHRDATQLFIHSIIFRYKVLGKT